MKNYIILKTEFIKHMEEKVELFESQGYKPLGGIAVGNGLLFQAMIKQCSSTDTE